MANSASTFAQVNAYTWIFSYRLYKYFLLSIHINLLHLHFFFSKELYELGARRIGFFSTPPIGCVPSQRTLAGGAERKCAENLNEAAKLFNSKLSKKLDSLGSSLPNGRFVYIDVYNLLLDLIQNPKKYGTKSTHFLYFLIRWISIQHFLESRTYQINYCTYGIRMNMWRILKYPWFVTCADFVVFRFSSCG
jgi:hypothetical protein